MKKSIFLAFVLILSFFVVIVLKAQNQPRKKSATSLGSHISVEATEIVFRYWELAANGELNQLEKLITETPLDFEVYSAACTSSNELNQTNTLENSPTIKLPSKGRSSTMREFNQNSTRIEFPLLIKNRNYVIKQVVEQRNFEDEALVRVGFGSNMSPWNQQVFLLKRKNNGWKIFAIMGNWHLEQVNKNFGKKRDCDE